MNNESSLLHKTKEAINAFIQDANINALSRYYDSTINYIQSSADIDMTDFLDVIIYLKIIEDTIKNNDTPQKVISALLITEKTLNNADILDAIMRQDNTHNVTGFCESNKEICYLDQNIFTEYINDSLSSSTIAVIQDYLIPYSPAHIEELSKSPQEYHQDELNRISAKTNNIEILFVDGYLKLVYESPFDVYKRINDGTSSRELAEKGKLIDEECIQHFLGEYGTDKLRNIYNSQSPEEFIDAHAELIDTLFVKLNRTYRLTEINTNINPCYSQLNSYIHDLYTIMDICGVKKDNSEHKIRSSRLDIEHLLYATCSNIFLTKDEKLRIRAQNIFKAINKKICCPKI